jgi:hypothetical protein
MQAPLTRFGPMVLTALSPQAGRGETRLPLGFANNPFWERDSRCVEVHDEQQ